MSHTSGIPVPANGSGYGLSRFVDFALALMVGDFGAVQVPAHWQPLVGKTLHGRTDRFHGETHLGATGYVRGGEWRMPALSDAVREKVKKVLDAQLGGPLQVVLFHAETADAQDEFTGVTREVLTELGELSGGQISLQEVQVADQPEKAQQFGIEQVPAMAFLDRDGRDQNLRFYGAPIGYEFMVLLEDLVDVSHQKSRLSDTAREQIQALAQPMVIQVFTTPT